MRLDRQTKVYRTFRPWILNQLELLLLLVSALDLRGRRRIEKKEGPTGVLPFPAHTECRRKNGANAIDR